MTPPPEVSALFPSPTPLPPSEPVPSVVIFKDQPIRFVVVDGLPWYSAEDVCAALGLALDLTLETDVAEQHKLLQVLPTPEGYHTGPVISPIGAWTLTLYRGRSLDYAFQRWVFKETKALQPDAFDREQYGAVQCMALRPDGDVPPRPHPKSGRAYERDDLKLLPEYQEFRSRTRTVIGLLRERHEDEKLSRRLDEIADQAVEEAMAAILAPEPSTVEQR